MSVHKVCFCATPCISQDSWDDTKVVQNHTVFYLAIGIANDYRIRAGFVESCRESLESKKMMSASGSKRDKKGVGKVSKTRIKEQVIDYYRNINAQLDDGFEDESMQG